MRKVLFVLDNLEGGGAERVFANIGNGFARHNVHVEFLLGHKKGIYLELLDSSIPVSEVGGSSLLDYLKFFPKFFRNNNYTHIFTASHYTSAAAIISKRLSGVSAKIIQTHHYAHPASRSLKYVKGDLVLKSIYFLLTPMADRVIAVSEGSLQWLRRFSHRSLKGATFIYNPVFDDSIYPLAEETLDFPVPVSGKTVLLSVGRLAEQKDQLTLIKAFQVYQKKNSNSVLFIVGTGPLHHVLERYIKQNQLTNEVILAGFQSNPYKWMANCDVFILSSIYEGFGNVIVEAMALGKTVVSTDCPAGPAEILAQGQLGHLCPVSNPLALADAISLAVEHPIDVATMKQASQQYRIDNVVQQYLAIL